MAKKRKVSAGELAAPADLNERFLAAEMRARESLVDPEALCCTLRALDYRSERAPAGIRVRCFGMHDDGPTCEVKLKKKQISFSCRGCGLSGDALDLIAGWMNGSRDSMLGRFEVLRVAFAIAELPLDLQKPDADPLKVRSVASEEIRLHDALGDVANAWRSWALQTRSDGDLYLARILGVLWKLSLGSSAEDLREPGVWAERISRNRWPDWPLLTRDESLIRGWPRLTSQLTALIDSARNAKIRVNTSDRTVANAEHYVELAFPWLIPLGGPDAETARIAVRNAIREGFETGLSADRLAAKIARAGPFGMPNAKAVWNRDGAHFQREERGEKRKAQMETLEAFLRTTASSASRTLERYGSWCTERGEKPLGKRLFAQEIAARGSGSGRANS